jgi:hypothetical protein
MAYSPLMRYITEGVGMDGGEFPEIESEEEEEEEEKEDEEEGEGEKRRKMDE